VFRFVFQLFDRYVWKPPAGSTFSKFFLKRFFIVMEFTGGPVLEKSFVDVEVLSWIIGTFSGASFVMKHVIVYSLAHLWGVYIKLCHSIFNCRSRLVVFKQSKLLRSERR